MADRSLDIALVLRANAKDAKAQLAQVRQEITGVEQAAARSNKTQLKSTRDLVTAQNAAMNRYHAARAPLRELDALLAKRALTTAEVAKAEQILDKAQAAGIISAGKLRAAFTALDAAKIKDAAVSKAVHASALGTTKAFAGSSKSARELQFAMRGLPAQFTDIFTSMASGQKPSLILLQQGGQIKDTFGGIRPALAGVGQALGKLINPYTLAAAAAVALLVAWKQGQDELIAYNKALILTGGYAGRTAAQLQEMAAQLDNVSGVTEHAAAAAVAQVTQTGRFVGEQIRMVSEAALEMQQATGQALDKTIDQFEKLGEDPVQGILDLNKSMHFLTQRTYDQITALVERGEKDKAAEVAQAAYASAIKRRTADVKENLGLLEKAWGGVTGAAKEAWDAMLDAGRADTTQDKIDKVKQELADAQRALTSPGDIRASSNPVAAARGIDLQTQGLSRATLQARVDALKSKLQGLENQQRADAGFAHGQSFAQQLIEQRIAAQAALKQYAPAEKKMQSELDAAAANRARALMGVVDPARRAEIEAQYQRQVKEIRDRAKQITTGGGGGGGDGAAAEIARQAAAAQQQLNQALVAIQTTADPTAAAYAKFNEQVKNASDLAEAAKKATDANTAAIELQKQALIDAAQAELDAAKKKIEAKRLADENQPVQDVMKQLAATGGYEVPVQIGGALGELLKADQQIAALNDLHRRAIQANEIFRMEDLANEEKYQQNKAQIEQDYRDRKAGLDAARHQLALQTASNVFGQLAALSSSQNKRMASIGKKAAIAQAVINTYESATAAYKSLAGIPVVGPALGIAAAAAAIAAGLANVQAIRAQPTGGYSAGGYTGPGGKYQHAGVVHAGEIVWSQADIARAGGVDIVDAMRLRGYADGGLVRAGDYASSPAARGFPTPATPRMPMSALVVTPVMVVVHNEGGGEVQSKQSTGSNGGQILELFLGAAAQDVGQGGKLAKAIDQRWIMKRKGNSYG